MRLPSLPHSQGRLWTQPLSMNAAGAGSGSRQQSNITRARGSREGLRFWLPAVTSPCLCSAEPGEEVEVTLQSWAGAILGGARDQRRHRFSFQCWPVPPPSHVVPSSCGALAVSEEIVLFPEALEAADSCVRHREPSQKARGCLSAVTDHTRGQKNSFKNSWLYF